MIRAAIISLGVLQVPLAAQACAIQPRTCDIAEGYASLVDHQGTAVLFDEVFGSPEHLRRRIILAECSSRRGVMVEEDSAHPEHFWAAGQYMADVLHDDRAHTLADVARHLRGIGVDADRVTLGAGHCGCDLPALPEPDNYCPGL